MYVQKYDIAFCGLCPFWVGVTRAVGTFSTNQCTVGSSRRQQGAQVQNALDECEHPGELLTSEFLAVWLDKTTRPYRRQVLVGRFHGLDLFLSISLSANRSSRERGRRQKVMDPPQRKEICGWLWGAPSKKLPIIEHRHVHGVRTNEEGTVSEPVPLLVSLSPSTTDSSVCCCLSLLQAIKPLLGTDDRCGSRVQFLPLSRSKWGIEGRM